MSRIRADQLVNRAGSGGPKFPNGVAEGFSVSGVVTATSFAGNLTGNVTGNVTGNTDTATNAQGLTGTPNITVQNATVQGNLTVNGTTTTIDTAVTAVDSLEIDGSVGIGTTNPGNFNGNADDLVIFGTGHQGLTIRSGTSHDGSIMFNDTDNANQRGIIRYAHTDDAMAFHTSGGEALRITSAGLVGIGVTNPTESLHIDGNLRMGSTADSGNFTDSGSTTTRALTIGAGGDALLVTHSTGQGLGYFGYEAAGDRLVIACDGGSGSNKMDFITDAGTDANGDNLNGKVPKMRITAAGNVGINSTAPAGALDVGGNVFPAADNTHDLGSSSKRWANIYTGDLNLSNEGSTNDVDGTWGQYTIQEGEDDLFLINRRTGKKYKFNLTEVD